MFLGFRMIAKYCKQDQTRIVSKFRMVDSFVHFHGKMARLGGTGFGLFSISLKK